MPNTDPLRRLRNLVDLADDDGAQEPGGSAPSPELLAQAQSVLVMPAPADVPAERAVTVEAADRAARILAQAVLDDAAATVRTNRRRGELRSVTAEIGRAGAALPRRVAGEVRHILLERPRTVLLRLAITLAMSLSLVTFYQVAGWSSYDARTLTLYLFAAVVGSVVCTNALCFDAAHVRRRVADGESLWRILVAKNIAMALLIGVTAAPVIAVLHVGDSHLNAAVLVDQLVAMLFIWMGVANVLSVLSPLRQEPLSARMHDGTWLPFLLSFAISYGMGLTVNVMIYWRLWARQAAAQEVSGGAWTAFLLVLSSSALTWILLTVFAVSCTRHPILRRILIRELNTPPPAR